MYRHHVFLPHIAVIVIIIIIDVGVVFRTDVHCAFLMCSLVWQVCSLVWPPLGGAPSGSQAPQQANQPAQHDKGHAHKGTILSNQDDYVSYVLMSLPYRPMRRMLSFERPHHGHGQGGWRRSPTPSHTATSQSAVLWASSSGTYGLVWCASSMSLGGRPPTSAQCLCTVGATSMAMSFSHSTRSFSMYHQAT